MAVQSRRRKEQLPSEWHSTTEPSLEFHELDAATGVPPPSRQSVPPRPDLMTNKCQFNPKIKVSVMKHRRGEASSRKDTPPGMAKKPAMAPLDLPGAPLDETQDTHRLQDASPVDYEGIISTGDP